MRLFDHWLIDRTNLLMLFEYSVFTYSSLLINFKVITIASLIVEWMFLIIYLFI